MCSFVREGSRIAESATRVGQDGKKSLRRRWRRKQRNQEVRGGKGGGGGNGEEQEEGGEDEACNTVPLLAVDLSARSIRWRKRRSREFHGDYHTRTILQFCRAITFSRRGFRVMFERKEKWIDRITRDYLYRLWQTHFSSIILSLTN